MEALQFRDRPALSQRSLALGRLFIGQQPRLDDAFPQKALDAAADGAEISRLGHKVQVVGVDRQERDSLQVGKVTVVCLAQGLDIVPIHASFVGAVALGDARHQNIGVRLEVDNEVRPWNLFRQSAVYLLIDIPFIFCQGQLGKEPVFGEHIVRDQRPR